MLCFALLWLFIIHLLQTYGRIRDVAKIFNWQESSNDRWVFGPLWHTSIPRGVWGHAPPPPRKILKMYTPRDAQRCIFLDFGDKIKGIQDRVLSGNDEKKNYDKLEC